MSLLKQGNVAFKNKDYKKAIDLYSKFINTNPLMSGLVQVNLDLCKQRLQSPNFDMSKYKTHDVVVCVHNAPYEVKRCLQSLVDKSFNLNTIIIVDDFSKEETKRILEEFAEKYPALVNLKTNPFQKGYTKTANIGMMSSDADVVTLLNSDTVVTKNWDKKIMSHLNADPAIGIIGPLSNAASSQSVPDTKNQGIQTAINSIPAGVSIDAINAFCEKNFSRSELPYTPLVHGFCMTITSECIQKLDGFNEIKFPKGYGEENDFCMRAQDAGYALAIAIDTYIYHEKSKSFSSTEREKLMMDGWNTLVELYGKDRLSRSISAMEENPILKLIRNEVLNNFYLQNKVFMPNPDLTFNQQVKSIAFYLPQFHPIKENDENWGEGFTEWSNVVKAQPRFDGHFQPKLPGKFGFYDLRYSGMMLEQAKLAASNGLDGFCFYYYRFGNKRVLDLPLNNYLTLGDNKLPFCFCWANESWTRAWDGKTSDVLLDQKYDDVTINGFIDDISEACLDPMYLNVGGRPLVLIYQVASLDNPQQTIQRIKTGVLAKTGKNPMMGTVFCPGFKDEMIDFLDIIVQFPPHRIPRVGHRKTIKREQMNPYDISKEDYYEAYDDIVLNATNEHSFKEKMVLGVTPDWDNSARRQTNATTIVGSTPDKFQKWVEISSEKTEKRFAEQRIPAPVIFVNAWNEWAEGAVLEPTEKFGYQYLVALKKGLSRHES